MVHLDIVAFETWTLNLDDTTYPTFGLVETDVIKLLFQFQPMRGKQ